MISAFSASTSSFCLRTFCNSWYGCCDVSSRIWLWRFSMVFFVRSLMARCASRSFARFFCSWSGVKLATPLDPVPVRRFLASRNVPGDVASASDEKSRRRLSRVPSTGDMSAGPRVWSGEADEVMAGGNGLDPESCTRFTPTKVASYATTPPVFTVLGARHAVDRPRFPRGASAFGACGI